MNKPLENKHPLIQLIAMLGLSLISLLLVMIVGFVIGAAVWGNDFTSAFLDASKNENYIEYMKYLQILSHLGMFIVPALIFGRLSGGNTISYFTLNKSTGIAVFFAALLLIAFAQPFINILVEWNQGLKLPDSMSSTQQWMQQSEDEANKMTELFMTTGTVSGLMVNLLMMALIPAIGEELVFRGVLQRLLVRWFRSAWIGITVASVIFSAIHVQFFGFVPRFVLGFVLGFVFQVSGRLWISIFIHFLNNSLAVITYWLYANKTISVSPDDIANFNNNIPVLLISIVLFLASFVLFQRVVANNRKKTAPTP
jgi:hypothetical protein